MALIGLLAGCAKSPESIAPAYVSEMQYQGYTCPQLVDEHTRIGQALTTASEQQENARSNDIAGIVLVGMPVSSFSGENIAPQIAQLKGQYEATRKAAISKNCRI
jgi:hypothetical protein